MTEFKQYGGVAIVAALLVAGASPARSADQPERTRITHQQIAGALVSSGYKVAHEQLESLTTITSAQMNPRLKVMNVEPLDENTAKARLRCENTSVCLPFYVILHWDTQNDAKAAFAVWRENTSGNARRPRGVEEILVRNGKAATMVFEGKNLRMTLPVTCLQNGARGQRVRVISKDRKKIYLARVIGPGMVTSAVVN